MKSVMTDLRLNILKNAPIKAF